MKYKFFDKEPHFYKNVFTLALPIAAQSLITIGVNMLDNIMVGSLGDNALSATSLANSFIGIYHIFCMGLGMGASVLVSRYWGMKKAHDNEEKADIHIVDFHAEATGEKLCLAFALDGKVSAVLGTHTHVQTKDYKILEGGTAYISDVGMTGYADGALGFDKDSVVNKITYGNHSRFDLPENGRGLFSAVVLDIDEFSGKCKEIFPIYYLEEK